MLQAMIELPSSKLLGKKAIILESSNAFAEEKLLTYVQCFYENIKDVDFYVDILKLLDGKSFTVSTCNNIKDWLMKVHWSDPNMWHGLAQIEKDGKIKRKLCV